MWHIFIGHVEKKCILPSYKGFGTYNLCHCDPHDIREEVFFARKIEKLKSCNFYLFSPQIFSSSFFPLFRQRIPELHHTRVSCNCQWQYPTFDEQYIQKNIVVGLFWIYSILWVPSDVKMSFINDVMQFWINFNVPLKRFFVINLIHCHHTILNPFLLTPWHHWRTLNAYVVLKHFPSLFY